MRHNIDSEIVMRCAQYIVHRVVSLPAYLFVVHLSLDLSVQQSQCSGSIRDQGVVVR